MTACETETTVDQLPLAVGPTTVIPDLEQLFHERYRPMVRLATWLLGDQGGAEEVVQDALVRLARRSADGGAIESPEAYLRTIVVNLCRTRQRRSTLGDRLLPVLAADRPTSSPGPEDLLTDDELATAVAALPRRQRECVVLRFTEGLKMAEIATTLGLSTGSVKKHLHRALQSLERELEAIGHEERTTL